MKKQHFLVLFLFLFCLSFALDAQNKYAVLITGDYSAEYIPQRSRWNQCDDEESRRPMQEFWNDTYLMWELLKKKGYSEDNIFVLFADGNDFIFDGQCPRYRPPIGVTVTDNSATIENVTNLFTGFQDGTSGMPILTNDDFLFVWVFDHGDTINGHSNFLLLDGMMNDIQFASLINPLQINRKVFWMQQCFGGGFAESLADNNTVFVSASQANQFAYRADNRTKDGTSIIENEFCIDTLYNHGEFDFHVFSVTNQESPNGDSYYAGVSYSSGDLNDDAYISMKETYVWDTTYNSIDHRSEKAMYNDLGNIGLNTSLEYPTLLYDNINNNETHRGIIGVSKDLYVSNGQTLTFTGKSNITLCNDAKLIIEAGGNLIIEGEVSFYGTNDNVLEIHGNFTNNSSDTIYFNNMQVEVTSESFTIGKAAFNDTELKYEPLSSSAISVLPSSGSITIRNCRFTNNNKQVAIRVKNSLGYYIDNNKITSSLGNGIYIMSSGNTSNAGNTIRKVSNNTVYGCIGTGLVFYASSGDVTLNNVYDNTIGVKLLNNCNIRNFTGRCSAAAGENTQYIHDNDSYEIYLTSNCAPQRMQYNLITDGGNTPYIYYDGNVAFGEPNIPSRSIIDVKRNAWGGSFVPSTHLYSTSSTVTYDYVPYWPMGTCFDDWTEAQQLIATADSMCELGEYVVANNAYRQVVNRHPHTPSAATALKSLLSLEKEMGQDFAALQQYYLTDSAIMSDTILCKLASALSNKCDLIMGNYADAIAWYEGAITNPNTTYCDSVFATIDLGNLYLELQNIGLKGTLNNSLNQFIPKSKEMFTTDTDKAIASLPRTNNRDYPYWTDIVTQQPEGYVELESGDVEISSAEGLAWLISVVNGLNGCEPDDFDGRKITLTTDIDLAYNGEKAFTPIGNRIHRFMGEFDGGRHSIEGLHLFYENNENAATSDLGLFGYVFHGTVRNLWVNSGSSAFVSQDPEQWYQGCIAGISDSLSLIDNCMVMARMSVTNGGGIVGMNRNSTIRNCTYAPPADNTFLVGWNGGGIALRNFSENGYTAEISNCYFYGNMLGSYSVQNEGGIVCFNETSSENGGKSAMVRNCYSELTGELFGNYDNGCIVAHNSEGSVVEYCYADLTKQYNGWGGLLGTDLGDTHNCISFIPDNGDGLLSESVSIGTDETTSLLEVLNYWISLYEIGVFNSWCEGETLPVFCNQSIGINETQPVVDTFVIYPNPTTGQFTVEGANVSKVEVYNLVGQKVCEQQGSKTVSIDAANWNKGVYLVNIIEQDGAVATKKLVVK